MAMEMISQRSVMELRKREKYRRYVLRRKQVEYIGLRTKDQEGGSAQPLPVPISACIVIIPITIPRHHKPLCPFSPVPPHYIPTFVVTWCGEDGSLG
jgi:hypothetical protein